MKKYAIYGAGIYGKALNKVLNQMMIYIQCFIQSDTPSVNETEGIAIYSFDDFISNAVEKKEWLIFLAIDNDKTCIYIKNQLIGYGIDEENIIFATRLVKENMHIASNQFCPICGKKVFFLPYDGDGDNQDFFEQKGIVGGGYRENAICSYCRRIDRHRFSYITSRKKIEEKINNVNKVKVLHFAPEYDLGILDSERIHYVKADLFPYDESVERVDVTNIRYEDKTFDIVVINHVLEHIVNEEKAVCELLRVIKEDGIVICSFPIAHRIEKTIETKKELSPEELLIQFGQKDHVRLYGLDFVERFNKYGAKVTVLRPKDVVDLNLIDEYGLIENDTILILEKGK